jgi:RNA recognition motif-containing protein
LSEETTDGENGGSRFAFSRTESPRRRIGNQGAERTISIFNVNPSVTGDDLKTAFARFGEVKNVQTFAPIVAGSG